MTPTMKMAAMVRRELLKTSVRLNVLASEYAKAMSSSYVELLVEFAQSVRDFLTSKTAEMLDDSAKRQRLSICLLVLPMLPISDW